MADLFAGQIAAELGWKWTGEDGSTVDRGSLRATSRLTDGTDADEAEAVWHVEDASLLNSASSTLDLTALTRTLFGSTHTTTLVTVRALAVVNDAASEGNLVIGDAASDAWTGPLGASGDTLIIPPGGSAFIHAPSAGWEVTASAKDLKLAAAGGDVTYSVAIIGTLTEAESGSSSA
jgi:hypothetical protein